jgi:esterase/lipase superfamily enzyme
LHLKHPRLLIAFMANTSPLYWMISNREIKAGGFGDDRAKLTFWTSDQGPLNRIQNWSQVSSDDFQRALVKATNKFPNVAPGENEEQSHVTFFVHGYNNGWKDAAARYEKLCADLYTGADGLGICISFDWPSCGSVLGYLPDRAHARDSARDLADILSRLFDWLIDKQDAAVESPSKACRAKVSMITHSMGNYVMQKAMAAAWTRKNQPLLVSLINQLLMVAADVDNDLFESRSSDGTDGNAVSNLSYRVTSLYSGRDAVLGASAGLKHFGVRRLGRSGLAFDPPTDKDNVWEVDCSTFFPPEISGMAIHSAYFDNADTLSLIRSVLRGVDRTVLANLGRTMGSAWPRIPVPSLSPAAT